MPSLLLRDVLPILQLLAPLELAEDWDNVGLLLGSQDQSVARIMTCLTITQDTVAEACHENADLVISHHPLFYRPVKRVTDQTQEGRLVLSLMRAGIAVYSAHTAYDNAPGGINDQIASILQLESVKPLRPALGERQCKIVVFVPESDLAKVSDALFAAGAGVIGQYRECSFRVAGTGSFFGTEVTQPTVGQKGRREEVAEWRLEVICPERLVDEAIRAMRAAHSYEEPAFDVYPLRPTYRPGGAGRIGVLPRELTLQMLVDKVRQHWQQESVRFVGPPEQMVRRVAIACGAGRDLLADALGAQADVIVTGEMRFHDLLSARAEGASVILLGHYSSERFAIENLSRRLKELLPDLTIWASHRERPVVLS
ncbi:MAG: Nif3-like dinuclear metal center hexameric protein [Gemmatales bacterium]|nr:Nif3-like dinuclear metal center hexameric protein [Gemmatales bacterium]MDW8223945.1 Nif3-like dinuclear metal center hexameric protein [Gemmatales bacterium]